MLFLGFSGGLNRVYENPFDLPNAFTHDGAAVLVHDGKVIAAIEEERLNRIKHSNKFPTQAIKYCLKTAGAELQDLDRIAFYATEEYCDTLLNQVYLQQPQVRQRLTARMVMHALLQQEFGTDLADDRIVFTRHHIAHATSAFAMSGFDESLVLVIDGYGDFLSGLVAIGKGHTLTDLETFPQNDSLGLLYLNTIRFLGYGPFDEYKVMGLAPYGNAETFRPQMQQLYELLPDGGYRLFLHKITSVLVDKIEIRKKGQPFTQQHKDLSAALQEALETIVFHILGHLRKSIGIGNLCLAGGVAHNCTMNGKILNSGIFDDIFVQPAAHDAGCALGAALMVSNEAGFPSEAKRLSHVYWGTNIEDSISIADELQAWKNFLEFEHVPDIAARTAELLHEGAVVGWVQGSSEFGPRALGNRSIIADPRPAANKERINKIVKKREGYRPFAPSVLEEYCQEYFEFPVGKTDFPFMIFVVNVREEKRPQLGAITHVDGTARPQTVSRRTNPVYWSLINEFKKLTGLPIILNTSFNNNVEPIVDSVNDSIVSFLTTELDYLVIGSYLVKKRNPSSKDWLALKISLPPYTRLHQMRSFVSAQELKTECEIRTSYSMTKKNPVSADLYELLMKVNGHSTVGSMIEAKNLTFNEIEDLTEECRNLWAERLICLHPSATE